MTVTLSVLTLNLRNILDRYDERRPLLSAEFGRLQPDLAGLQEVAFTEGEVQDAMLAAAAPGRAYQLFDARSARFPDYGNSLMIAVGHPEVTEELRLTNGRCAVRALVVLPGNLTLWFATTHLHHRPAEPAERVAQVEAVVQWMNAAPAADATVITGDFNAPPFEPAVARMQDAGYRSAFASVHGAEPPVTWPSGIQAEGMDTDGDPNCLDYVWLRGAVEPLEARLVFDRPAAWDSTLYPSDHFGILCRVRVDSASAADR